MLEKGGNQTVCIMHHGRLIFARRPMFPHGRLIFAIIPMCPGHGVMEVFGFIQILFLSKLTSM